MVVFQEEDPYFFDTMKAMNVMRKDVALCDIVLTFGQQTIHAHRCVLAAASPYFNSLFLGNFSETSMGNIDLSSVTTDTEAVEMIIDFIYAGEINITDDNLGTVIKLASFFLVKQLSAICVEFMKESLNLRNCLRYFFYAQDYGHHEGCQNIVSMVESRFHDFIIFEEGSLDISPGEMHFLLTRKVLKFCHGSDLLEFVLKWLLKGPTEKHFAVALDIIDKMSRHKNMACLPQRENDLESFYEKVASRQEVLGSDNGKKFLKNSRKVMSKMFSCCSSVVQKYNLRSHGPKLSSKQEGNTEMALVAFAPRPCLVEAVEVWMENGGFYPVAESFTEPVLDVCVYLVSKQTWYHVQQLADKGVPNHFLDETAFYEWTFATMRDRLLFISQEANNIFFLDLQQMTYREVSYRQLNNDLLSGSTFICFEVISVVGANQAVYLVLKIIDWADDGYEVIDQVYFRCYRLRNNDEWELVFQTPKFSTEDEYGDTVALVSAESNEMLIYHSSDNNKCAYLADMSEQNPHPIQLLMTSETKEFFQSNHLLEGKHQIYVVEYHLQQVFVTYEYKLNSRKLVPVPATPAYFPLLEGHFSFKGRYPCRSMYTINDGTSLWRFEGSKQRASHLTEVRVSQNKGLEQIKHTPPPFPYVSAVFAGRLDKNIISRLEPIARYLSP